MPSVLVTPVSRHTARECQLYAGLIVILATAYAVAAVLPDGVRNRYPDLASMLFGFDQLEPLSWAALALPFLAVGALLFPWDRLAAVPRRVDVRLDRLSPRARVLLAFIAGAVAFPVFMGLRNQSLNPDGLALAGKFRADVPINGAHLTHDEILELYVHSRFWYHTSRAFGWSVEYSYQVLSSLSGAVFVVLLVAFGRRLVGKGYGIFFVGVVAGGFMQLFFGDVENYTLVTTLTLLYFFMGHLFVEDRVNLLVPTVVLAVAICFHLLAAFLLPSLAWLYLVGLRRGATRSVVAANAVLIVVPAAVVAYFHFNGLPIESIRTSNSMGQAGNLQRYASPSLRYHGQITSLLFLLFPPLVLVVPLMAFRRVRMTPFAAFMSVASGTMLVFMFVWRSDIGVYNDWNLYAPAALPLAILFWYSFVRADQLPRKAWLVAALVLTSGFHSYAWIVDNHLLP